MQMASAMMLHQAQPIGKQPSKTLTDTLIRCVSWQHLYNSDVEPFLSPHLLATIQIIIGDLSRLLEIAPLFFAFNLCFLFLCFFAEIIEYTELEIFR